MILQKEGRGSAGKKKFQGGVWQREGKIQKKNKREKVKIPHGAH